MLSLSPKLSSRIAEIPYSVFSTNSLNVSGYIAKFFTFDLRNDVKKGTTSGILGFGGMTSDFVAIGRGKREFSDTLVFTFRGTQKNVGDIMTDGNIGISGTQSGYSVHAGFINLFNTIKNQLSNYISNYIKKHNKAPKAIHCVGHSLGGALASLAADWVKSKYSYNVHLYTFGAPKVGFKPYSRIELDASYRCTHGADPVPMAPLWPFTHGGVEYRLDGSTGIYFCAHGLGKKSVPGYVNTAKSSEWSKLEPTSQKYLEKQVFLHFNNSHNAKMNDGWISRIVSAILTLLRISGLGYLIQQFATVGLTAWDRLAKAIAYISDLNEEYTEHVRGILGHMNVMSGNPTIDLSNITYKIISLSFSKLIRRLNLHVKNALNVAEY
ncbi:lipase family protein [Vibrio rotiferianus]|uniref:lipase family protein n=1 Tax=Vibrio rotiferianus TaxID=190895 RepID=UPI00406A10CA